MNVADALRVVADPAEMPRKMVEFFPPSALRAYTPPFDHNMVGDFHVQRGSPFAIAGPPGVGKSRVATALAVAGAKGKGADFMGLPVHVPFKTMILQAENGRVRLREEYAEISDPAYDDYIRVCPPPPYGFAFDHPDFAAQLAEALAEFKPDVFILDPWNRATNDDKSRDYLATFERLQGIVANGDRSPALGIVAHTRKPMAGERSNGRSLLNTLAGGYALGSVPRSVFVVQHASDDSEETRVVWTCCKNNDGPLGERTAWVRAKGLFLPAEDFDWEEFDTPPEKRRSIGIGDLEAIFKNPDGGWLELTRADAVELLKRQTDCKPTACYNALSETGKFKDRIRVKGKLYTLK